MKKLLIAIAIVFVCGLGLFAVKAHAAELDITIDSSDGSDGSDILDDDYNSTEHFEGGTTLTLNAEEPIDSVYIKWDSIPTAWTMSDGEKKISCGENGFLHEFVQLSGTEDSVTITIPNGGATIADVYAFSTGELPDFVQKWEKPWDQADILFISTHADDEVLFFGGMIPIYTNEDRARVQVAYFTDFFQTETYRNHELLDGLWTMGVDHYPQLGKFYDNYSESLEEAEEQFDHEESLEYIVETIRRFQPQVLVTHDIEGEYGHGTHRYVSKLVREALDITNDASKYKTSADKYGTWDVPKTYLHLYAENPIEMDTRAPLADFGGKNALEVAKEAYEKHQSQQWMWFFVDDGYDEEGNPNDYEYSCAKYGLYRSLVGADTSGNDVLDNITVYAKQEQKTEQETSVEEETTTAIPKKDQETNPKGNKTLVIILIIIAVLIILFLVIFLVSRSRKKKRQAEMERRARARRAAEARRREREWDDVEFERDDFGESSDRSQTRSSSGTRTSSRTRSSSGTRTSSGSRSSSGNRTSSGARTSSSSRTSSGSRVNRSNNRR